jgi:hypothetical protein
VIRFGGFAIAVDNGKPSSRHLFTRIRIAS